MGYKDVDELFEIEERMKRMYAKRINDAEKLVEEMKRQVYLLREHMGEENYEEALKEWKSRGKL